MINAKQMKVGMVVQFEGDLYRVMDVQHTAPGKGQAFVQAKLRNLRKGHQIERKFRSQESVERAYLDVRSAEYLYQDGDHFHFMDTENYEQFHLTTDLLGDAIQYLVPNMKLSVEQFEGTPIGVELPKTVNLQVTETEPYVKTATVTNSFKGAKVETGATFQVPGFISVGEVVEIDTATGKYVGRAKEN